MGVLSRLRNYFSRSPTTVRYELITEHGNGFYAWNGSLYQSDIVRGCIRPLYKAAGKLLAKHVRQTERGLQINPDVYMKMLLAEPNPFMTGQQLQEKLAIQLALNNNAFAAIIRDENGYSMQIYPVPAMGVEALYDQQGQLYLKFTLRTGKTVTFAYADVVHLRQDYNDNDVFGSPPGKALASLMEIVTTTDQGIVKAIKNSAVIRWLLRFKQTLRPEDIKQQTKAFVESYLSVDSEDSVGAAGVDAKADVEQVEPKDYVPNAAQMDRTTKRIYNFFGTNEAIIQSKFTEDEWNAYYEAVIEPIAIQMSNEFTRKLFSRRERGFGNRIIFESNTLQYASMKTKLELRQMVDRGAMTPNEWRLVLNLGPIEGGDKPIRRLDTAEVSGDEKVTGGDED